MSTTACTALARMKSDASKGKLKDIIKDGRPLAVGWSDGEASLRLRIDPGAQVIDHMGRVRELSRTGYNMRLGPNAVAVHGVSYSYDYAESKPVSGLPILPILGLKGVW